MSVKVHTSAMLSVALLLSTSMASTSAFAAVTSNDVSKTAAQSSMMDKRLMVSNDGFNAERELANARIAIFQGTPETAKTLVKDAQADLKTVAQQAPKDFPNGAPTADGRGTGNADVIPINGEMTVVDNMVLTPDKASKVKEANEHLKNGDTTKGKYPRGADLG